MGQCLRLLAANEDAVLAVHVCVEMAFLPYGSWVICSGSVPDDDLGDKSLLGTPCVVR
jgi:hypothetical protein